MYKFQFTHPGKGATQTSAHYGVDVPFQFTHPGKGATPQLSPIVTIQLLVSIHAPWEGCDYETFAFRYACCGVSIHAPWEGCDG